MPFPSADLLPVRFGPGGGYFDFMGREPLEPLLDLMRTLSRGSKIPISATGEGETDLLNVYGTRGFGKSFMLAAAVAVLLKEGHRVVFVPNARDVADKAIQCLRGSFAVAFPDLIDDIASCGSVPELASFVANLDYLLVVDQLNALEATALLGHKAERALSDLTSIRGACAYVCGYSANNANATIFAAKQRNERDFYCFGGMSDVEFGAWWARHFRSDGSKGDGSSKGDESEGDGSSKGDESEGDGSSKGDESEGDDLADRLRTLAREDLGGVPLLLTGLLKQVGSPLRATQATLDACLSYIEGLAISTVSELRDWFGDDGPISEMKRKTSMNILAGARAGVTDHPTSYDHRYFFAGPPTSSRPVFTAVCGVALAALAEIVRGFNMHDDFLNLEFLRGCREARNPVVKGFLVEHAVISSIRARGLTLPNDAKYSGPLAIVQYRDVESVTVAPSPCVLYVPTAFNEKDVDAVLRHVEKDTVTIVALQITIGKISRHAHSVRFFTKAQDTRWVEGFSADAVQRLFVWVVLADEARSFRDSHTPRNLRRGRSAQTESKFEQLSIAIRDVCPGLATF
eukprot:Opistho-1_new@56207